LSNPLRDPWQSTRHKYASLRYDALFISLHRGAL
jgi:hypothetical protein